MPISNPLQTDERQPSLRPLLIGHFRSVVAHLAPHS